MDGMRTYEELMEDEALDFEQDSAAQYELALCYATGNGCSVDLTKAEEWMRKAAALGHLDAIEKINAWNREANKEQVKPLEDAVALESLSDLALYMRGEEGDIHAALLFAKRCESNKDKAVDAMRLLQRFSYDDCADEASLGELNYRLGEAYRRGYGVEVDAKKAFEYFSNAAEVKENKAYARLADCYEKGIGTTKDMQKALYYRELMANTGTLQDIYDLAYRYYEGIGVPQNTMKALIWFHKGIQKEQREELYYYLCEYYLMINEEHITHTSEEVLARIEAEAQQGQAQCLAIMLEECRTHKDWEGCYAYEKRLYESASGKQKEAWKQDLIQTLMKLGEARVMEEAATLPFRDELFRAGICHGYEACLDEVMHPIAQTQEEPLSQITQMLSCLAALQPDNEQGKRLIQETMEALKQRKQAIEDEQQAQRAQQEQVHRETVKAVKSPIKKKPVLGIALIVLIIAGMLASGGKFVVDKLLYDPFKNVVIHTEGFSPNLTIRDIEGDPQTTYTAEQETNLKNGDMVTVKAVDKEGREKEKKLRIESKNVLLSSAKQCEKYKKQLQSLLLEDTFRYFGGEDPYMDSEYDSLKLVNVKLLTRKDTSMTSTDNLFNQLIGIIEVHKKDGERSYTYFKEYNVGITKDGIENVDVDINLEKWSEDTYPTLEQAQQALMQAGFQVEDVAFSYEVTMTASSTQLNAKEMKLLTDKQAEAQRDALKSILTTWMQEKIKLGYGSFDEVEAYELADVSFGFIHDRQCIYQDRAVNALVGVFKVKREDGKVRYLGAALPNVLYDEENNKVEWKGEASYSEFQNSVDEARAEVEKRFSLTQLKE